MKGFVHTNHSQSKNKNKNLPSQTLQNFDKFLRKRNQKQSILHSHSDSIVQKINSFDELLRLTKEGNMIIMNQTAGANHHFEKEKLDKNVMKKFKTCKVILDANQSQSKIDGDDNSEQNSRKLQKLMDDDPINLIEQCFEKQNVGYHFQNEQEIDNAKPKANRTTHHFTSSKLTRINSPLLRESAGHLEERGTKNHYLPMKKNKIEHCVKRMNRKINRTQKNTLQTPFIVKEINNTNFSNLKRNIDELQQKAKTKYGIQFKDFKEQSILSKSDQKPQFDQSNSHFKENNWFEFSNKQSASYKQMIKNNAQRQDSSIPHSLLAALPPYHQKQTHNMHKFRGNSYIRI